MASGESVNALWLFKKNAYLVTTYVYLKKKNTLVSKDALTCSPWLAPSTSITTKKTVNVKKK